MIRVGEVSQTGSFNPRITLFNPSGVQLDAGSGSLAAEIAVTATNTGTFTVNVDDVGADATGTYRLTLAKAPGASITVAPGDEGGALTNGLMYPGTIEVGDLDVWSFTAASGDYLNVEMGEMVDGSTLYPYLRLYGPDGRLLDFSYGAAAALVSFRATNSGTFIVVAGDGTTGNFGTGTYRLTLAKTGSVIVTSAGDEGGALTNGLMHLGTIEVGDLDVWSFTAASGDYLNVEMGEVVSGSTLYPYLELYGPDGQLLKFSAGAAAALVSFRATNNGTFIVVARDGTTGNFGTGTYRLTLAKTGSVIVTSAGDEGGALTNGLMYPGTIEVGDLDVWSFTAASGDYLNVEMGEMVDGSTLYPYLRLYGPDGQLLDSFYGAAAARVSFLATNSGTFTVVAGDGTTGSFGTGTYRLTLAKTGSSVVISTGDEGGPMSNGFTHSGTNDVGDLDLWVVDGTLGDSNVVRVTASGFTVAVNLYGPTGIPLRSITTSSSNSFNYIVTNAGPHLVLVHSSSLGASGTYTVRLSKVPPDLIVPVTQTISELTPLNVSISAADPDDPTKALTFTKIAAPSGVVFTSAGPTNTMISWTPTEADGPSTNVIMASVTDRVNGKDFIRTNSFTVVVNEINVAPVLNVPGTQTINELAALNVSVSATDADIPGNTLTFSLNSPPSGVTINTNTGAIAWTPTEAQGPSTNTITVVVTDFNAVAVNTQRLSTTNSFTVIVNELNVAPVLTAIANRTINPGQVLTITNVATDSDLPANALTFSLVTPPSGVGINPSSGVLTWRPTIAQADSTHTISVRVTDNGASNLSDTKNFNVVVRPLAAVTLTPLSFGGGQLQMSISGTVGPDYIIQSSSTLTNWTARWTNTPASTPFNYIDNTAGAATNRFYRVLLGP